MAKGRGGGKTPERIIEMLKRANEDKSQSAISKEIDIPLYSLQKYLKGVAEPTQDTLAKISKWCGWSIAWLRGEEAFYYPFDETFEESEIIINPDSEYWVQYKDVIATGELPVKNLHTLLESLDKKISQLKQIEHSANTESMNNHIMYLHFVVSNYLELVGKIHMVPGKRLTPKA